MDSFFKLLLVVLMLYEVDDHRDLAVRMSHRVRFTALRLILRGHGIIGNLIQALYFSRFKREPWLGRIVLKRFKCFIIRIYISRSLTAVVIVYHLILIRARQNYRRLGIIRKVTVLKSKRGE